MNPILIIVISLLFLLFLGGMVGLAIYQLKKTDPKNIDTSIGSNVQTAQDFLPFLDMEDRVINLGGHEYRAILECNSIDYFLRTNKEREIIEVSYQRFVNSLTFPISILIQTRTMDNTKMLNELRDELREIIEKHPQMEEYANVYFNEMSSLPDHMGNNHQKKKYIIVSYNEANELNDLTEDEKYQYSINEIIQRALMVAESLYPTGVRPRLLDTKDIVELIYSTYHKDDYSFHENISSGDALALIVDGGNPELSMGGDKRIDSILYEAQKKIEKQVMTKDLPSYLREEYKSVLQNINTIRDSIGAYYKG